MSIRSLIDKFLISGEITLLTGMHIGSSNDFAPIGAVDSLVVRDSRTKIPIIPGSSLKGKMRTLLAKSISKSPILKKHNEDPLALCRLFGASNYKGSDSNDKIMTSRLQFYDLFMADESIKELDKKTDLYLTEIKFENTINRTTAVANPRQLERVPAGAKFKLFLIYDAEVNGSENQDKDMTDKAVIIKEAKDDIIEDFENIAKALKLIQLDYIGGHGTRGYGKIGISGLKVEAKNINGFDVSQLLTQLSQIIKGADYYAPLFV